MRPPGRNHSGSSFTTPKIVKVTGVGRGDGRERPGACPSRTSSLDRVVVAAAGRRYCSVRSSPRRCSSRQNTSAGRALRGGRATRSSISARSVSAGGELAGQDLVHRGELAGDEVAVDLVQQLLLAREVVVEAALRDAGAADHLRDARPVVALLGEQVDRRLEHAIPGVGHVLRCVLAQFLAGDRAQVHLVGAVGEVQRAQLRPRHRERGVAGDAGAAVAWIALVEDVGAARGAATLMAAISVRAFLAPTVSISHAALSTSRRAWSIAIRDSAIHSCTTPCWATAGRTPSADGAGAHQLERALGHAEAAHAVVDAAGTESGLRHHEPAALRAEQVLGRHPALS